MDERDIAAVLAKYDLGELKRASPFDCDHRRPWKASTDSGDFVVRECFLSSRADLEFEHGLASWLHGRGFPVSVPVAARRGGTSCELDGRLFAVHTLVGGTPFRAGNTAQAGSAGAALAGFHSVASAFPQARGRKPPQGFRFPRDDADFLLGKRGDREEIARLAAGFSRLDGELRSQRCPESLLFNDFQPGNVLFAADEFAGAFDLDCCCWGPRLLDIAKSVLAFSLSLEGAEGVPATVFFHVPCARSFLEGYRRRRGLEPEELRLLPAALRREVRAGALFGLRDVEHHARRWVEHEWELCRRQIDLVDDGCGAVVGNGT